ncbi:pantetheine-phosphate adenylyltransferase [Kribbella antibiotica]|uniref:Phosphopantetheine adenylyltransferase n=1 Tax=Kribbella antibiotica TaxID=190195 RepID=A0A4R4ZLZ4_9ACTN|nr:pantetheine-phosphate adenylyltransferase [Kribbella antibiotica]TDD57862.1 pantetheine-phosphate adenylyltransferase [Kribbella antibiotica]
MAKAVFPGSFDPPTIGHLDVITRAAGAFEELIVAAGVNQSKNRLFSDDERVEMLTELAEPFPNVRIATFSGLVVDFCTAQGASVLVKGLRTAADYDYELQMAHLNRRMTGVDTVFLPSAPEHGFISSSWVKEISKLGGDVSTFVTPSVHTRLLAKYE